MWFKLYSLNKLPAYIHMTVTTTYLDSFWLLWSLYTIEYYPTYVISIWVYFFTVMTV